MKKSEVSNARRDFLKQLAMVGAALSLPGCGIGTGTGRELFFDISLAEWSLHRSLNDGKLTNLEFPTYTKKTFGIEAVEYVNSFFFDKAKNKEYLGELKTITDNEGIRNVLIMIDREGALGDQDETERMKAVENHYKWIEAAEFLGCHSIRVNAAGSGPREEVKSAVERSLGELCTFAKDYDINVIVENHGGYSSDGSWLASTIEKVGMDNCGTLPDFGNFTIDRKEDIKYDRYKGVKELMPYAKAVSAKCYHFEEGEETTIDFMRMMEIVKNAGYTGHVGIEYEGSKMSEEEGIKAAKELLIKVGKKLKEA